MAQVALKSKPPRFVATALAALRREFGGAAVDAEPVPGPDGDYYRLAVVSDRFKRGAYVGRHDEVWAVAKRVLTEGQLRRITMILALRPEELNGH